MYTTAQFPLVRLASATAEGGVRGMIIITQRATENARRDTEGFAEIIYS